MSSVRLGNDARHRIPLRAAPFDATRYISGVNLVLARRIGRTQEHHPLGVAVVVILLIKKEEVGAVPIEPRVGELHAQKPAIHVGVKSWPRTVEINRAGRWRQPDQPLDLEAREFQPSRPPIGRNVRGSVTAAMPRTLRGRETRSCAGRRPWRAHRATGRGAVR